MKNRIFPLIILVLVLAGGAWYVSRPAETKADLDEFAKCIADKEITMYGAAWCSHCQNQKRAFGNSFRLVPYVECPENPELCTAKGVDGYPTWVFPDGRKLVGEQGLAKLSAATGCALPVSK